jgi:hypothetical protein
MTRPAAAVLVFFAAAAALRASDVDAATRARAARVFSALDAIREEARSMTGRDPRRMMITEDEINAYIACRIADENEPALKDLRLKLLGENTFEGLAAIDLGGAPAAGAFRGRMTLLFRGRVESGAGRVRLEIDDIFCEGQRIQPDLLDFLILMGSRLTGNEPFSLKDWFELPEGVRGLEVGRGALVAVYGPA